MPLNPGQQHSQRRNGVVAQALAHLQNSSATKKNHLASTTPIRVRLRLSVVLFFIVLLSILLFAVHMPGYSLLLLGSCLLCIVIILGYRTQWAGFGAYDPPSDKHQRMKTLWDWLQLLIIPVFLTGGGFWFTAQQNALSQQLSQQQYNQSKWITSDQQKDMTLVTTMNDLSDLLLNKGLYASQPGAEVRVIARAKILSAFSVLDTTRKSRLLRFLVEAQIVTSKPSQEPIISLSGADLSGANLLIINLSGADLRNVNLSQANLSKADLTGADLTCADLSNANLSKADLSGANLNGIELNGTNLSNANLKEARRGDPQRSKCP